MSAAQLLPDATIRSQTYYVARADTQCRQCDMPIRLLALVVPNGHETLEPDPPADADADADTDTDTDTDAGAGAIDGDGVAPDAWQHANFNALLFYVEDLPDHVQRRLNQLSPCFRLAYSKITLNSYWANHCEHCGALVEDHELHCEFDGAFMPSDEEAAAKIQLLQIPEALEAVAAGYSFEPEFLRFMRKA